ncbi:hypothetical protein CHGG_07924 [Chaetomium globosum CBS 148.51]|uniref:RNA helicase n=1 Tax=Chaetomium globosum (strain ATCC 6205 / CBS 148.51 / DSM 1962 / NBRC 6347 / NRRL 1970) TaxID=306901 RepID=Q2GVT0_CHAGB|nr:uncharacterized protein CHGG_07924 [Chaetomium globosum CBS 148.51]EAQ86671.1 hypothetical protein CHGG_07924 [Chaetomium globosum CBS 148.51]
MADFDLGAAFIPALHKPAELLPIAKHRKSLLYLIETSPVTIVVGQTGSGKSTQIPQFLERAGWCADGKIIGITQPRRVAATTVAIRVAEEFGCDVGKEVGYSIRFEDATSETTRIKFLTDGLLIREALVDPLLSRYSVIMVDEAHERSISSDILLGLLKKIRKKRPDLRIIISSATLQAEEFRNFFSEPKEETPNGKENGDNASIVSLEGRTYPIDILYLDSPAEDYLDKAVSTVIDIHTNEPKGDILISKCTCSRKRSENFRKVIFSTNISEASVTIDGIVYVVDSGFVKLRAYDPKTGIESLTATPLSKASAAQRAGRAGRTKPGKCFRLYTEEAYQSLPEANIPEIQRSNLAPFVLQLKALGIDNVLRFDFLAPPPAELMVRGLELLYSLGALDDYAKLTRPLGLRMAELAVEPMMAKTLLSAQSFGCLSEILTIAAMTSLGGNIWIQHEGEKKKTESAKRKFAAEEGDQLTLLNVYQAFVTKGRKESRFCHENLLNFKLMARAVSIRAQLKRYLERFGLNVDESLAAHSTSTASNKAEQIQRCLTAGYFAHAARMQPDGTFRNVSGTTVLHAHPSSIMFNRKAEWVIFHEVMETGNKTFIRDITRIEKSWLLEYAPEFYKTT